MIKFPDTAIPDVQRRGEIVVACRACQRKVRVDPKRYKIAKCSCGASLKKEASNIIVDVYNKAGWCGDAKRVEELQPLFDEIIFEIFGSLVRYKRNK
jgi:hypothetical protein